ncbi:dual specificity protein phosphatase family protein [Pseudoalteromonas luteoviolacea]|uniref:phosphatase domain-containing putative toxin n=1 Tax=Pseudoalteromonas luteoviolacea TaxID=43657 RepID=UPI001B370E7A|nr:dual specificity protein phosphatase family protein [Pseudoalteromonas luteoviolacea]MBQ4810214.1 dual specificity protein phosphatase family protein [Pseudoalteromonas luteoviolacea]
MQTHPFDKLTLDNGTTFIFTPCPGTKEVALEASVRHLQEAGAQAIVTLMYDTEMQKHNAEDLPTACEKLGVQWFQLPLPDDDAPNVDFTQAYNANIAAIMSILEQKGTLAVHCKGGSGRTGLVIGLLMKQLGYENEQIIKQVQQIRPKALKHPTQLAFFNNF